VTQLWVEHVLLIVAEVWVEHILEDVGDNNSLMVDLCDEQHSSLTQLWVEHLLLVDDKKNVLCKNQTLFLVMLLLTFHGV